jgi:hypothetical protein
MSTVVRAYACASCICIRYIQGVACRAGCQLRASCCVASLIRWLWFGHCCLENCGSSCVLLHGDRAAGGMLQVVSAAIQRVLVASMACIRSTESVAAWPHISGVATPASWLSTQHRHCLAGDARQESFGVLSAGLGVYCLITATYIAFCSLDADGSAP